MISDIQFSIIVPTYNCAAALEKTLSSIVSQTFSNWECIIVDGDSNDNTLEIVRRFQFEYPALNIKFNSEKDFGIYDAMNKGALMATGRFVYYIGAGDTFANHETLQEISHELVADIVYGYVVTENGIIKNKMNFWTSFRYRPICHQAIFAKRELLVNFPFELQYKYVADQAWIMKMFRNGVQYKYVNIAIAKYGLDGFSSTEEGRNRGREEIRHAKMKYFPIQSKIISIFK